MRNVFLCFFALFLFAPEMAGAAGRSVQKNDSNTDAVRVASPVRGTASRNTTNASRTTTSPARATENAPRSISTRGTTAKTESRSINQSTVVQRTADKSSNGVLLKRRSSEPKMTMMDKFRADLERNVSNRAATKKYSAEDVAKAKEFMEQTAALNKSCQEQYNECMDQFCAVVDSNQKRCSCSANLSKYASAQDAVTKANDELNTVAQRIRYVGLSADEIRAIMTETEAEAELDGKRDTSETRSMLSRIETLIKDPTTKTTTLATNDFGLDLELDFSDDSADLFSLDFLNGDTDSISSKRGTALYSAAKKRCKTILNNCADVGATTNQITGNYDLAIDKDCVAYEQGLKKMNQTLQSNVRSAGVMLQKARLAVMQNKNQYDPKGCIAALESCMTDDMVCGADYEKCLDPTKRYIDENGKVVLGQDITNITDFMEKFNNGNIDTAKLLSANSIIINEEQCKNSSNNDGACVIKYLLTKIGTGATTKDGGLCRAVLDKCQQYTYNLSGDKYNPYNDIVVNYVQRAMVNIKSSQQKIISNYASSCMTDVAACYNQQVTQVNSWSSVASVSSIKSVMTGACRNVALTCAYAVFANMCTVGEQNATKWVLAEKCSTGSTNTDNTDQNSDTNAENNGTNNNVCAMVNDSLQSCTPCDAEHPTQCIEGISEIFYQSLLCPENSTYDKNCATASNQNRTINGCVNTQCRCNDEFSVWGGSCMSKCGANQFRNDYGSCEECKSPKEVSGGSDATETEKAKEPNQCTVPTNTSQNLGNTNSSTNSSALQQGADQG